MQERAICKEKCDRIKSNIRTNRHKFEQNVREYGDDKELEEDADKIEEEKHDASQQQQQHTQRMSVAPS